MTTWFRHSSKRPFATRTGLPFKAAGESDFAFTASTQNAPLRGTINSLVEFLRRMFPNPISLNHDALLIYCDQFQGENGSVSYWRLAGKGGPSLKARKKDRPA